MYLWYSWCLSKLKYGALYEGPVGNNVDIIVLDTGLANLGAGPMAAELKALNVRNIEKALAKENGALNKACQSRN